MKRERFAVIGSGAAGLAAAWRLHQAGHVTMYEREGRLGGHEWTICVDDGPDAELQLEIAFMIMNDQRYPTMSAILATLPSVELAESDMSFSYTCRQSGHSYAINRPRTSAGRATPARVSHARLISQALHFSRIAQHDLTTDHIDALTLGEYLAQRGVDALGDRRCLLDIGFRDHDRDQVPGRQLADRTGQVLARDKGPDSGLRERRLHEVGVDDVLGSVNDLHAPNAIGTGCRTQTRVTL